MAHRKIRHKVYEDLEITGLSSEGLGIARVDEKVVFVEQCIPGDVVKARTFQRRKNFEKARSGNTFPMKSKSPLRIKLYLTPSHVWQKWRSMHDYLFYRL